LLEIHFHFTLIKAKVFLTATTKKAGAPEAEIPENQPTKAEAPETELEQIRGALSEEARALFDADRVKAGNDADFFNDLQNKNGDPIKRYNSEAVKRGNATQQKLESEQRVQTSYDEITNNSDFMNSKDMQHALSQSEIPATRSAIATEIVRNQVQGEFPIANGYKVMTEVKIIQEIPGFNTRQEWHNANPTGNPKGIIEIDGKIYRPVTDIDVLAAKSLENGQFEIVHMEQIKSGATDQPIKAQSQNENAATALEKLKSGDSTLRILKDGDITSQFNYDNVQDIKAVTRGPSEKTGFDRSIGLNSKELKKLAESIHAKFKK
jgi:hypothetical protein